MEFYFNMTTAYFTAGQKNAILDRYHYEMKAPALPAGSDVLVPAEDLVKIYSPDMTAEVETASYKGNLITGEEIHFEPGDRISLSMNGVSICLSAGSGKAVIEGNPFHMKTACQAVDGVIYVPAGQIMHFAFGRTVRSTEDMSPSYISAEERAMFRFGSWPKKDVTVGISTDPQFQLEGEFFRWQEVYRRGKKYGNQYRTYWMQEPGKVVPYIVYVPTGYNPEVPSRLVVFLHGGSINVGERYAEIFGGTELQKAAQKYNYILLLANACTLLSAWGNPLPVSMTEEERRYYQWGDDSAMQAIEEVKKNYNIDTEHIYLMGNSMGGGGTFYLPTAHPGMFRAIAPGGNLAVMRPDDLTELYRIPVLIPCGTEDSFGFDNYLKTVEMLNEGGGRARAVIVGGGEHLTAWGEVVDTIFSFFEENA